MSSPTAASLPARVGVEAAGLLRRLWSDRELGHSLAGSKEHLGGEDSRRGVSTGKRWPEMGSSGLRRETEVFLGSGMLREDAWDLRGAH